MNSKNTASLVHRIASFETQYLNKKLRSLDLNSDQGRSINFIANHPDSMQRDVARYLNRQEASVTNLLKGLVKRNLIVRTIPLTNERTKLLSLTKEGTALVPQIQEVFEQLNSLLEAPLSDAEATKLTQLLNNVQKQLDDNEEA
ncbi:MarR family winged helix-turn-helix transcriptional regulator [Secundilactobacillus folii]|uniref:Winged helix DNA-binding protein n=1 Tax=Secundilactobacillus folii TaxID=2678357 RepID=A0A7X3C3S8_9LACO|nr:MarR family transcriptional regulator [Secundilactobacillus folii]MTV83172.1 winged helix DNA-binding protein [Secundilactobacillus folii]